MIVLVSTPNLFPFPKFQDKKETRSTLVILTELVVSLSHHPTTASANSIERCDIVDYCYSESSSRWPLSILARRLLSYAAMCLSSSSSFCRSDRPIVLVIVVGTVLLFRFLSSLPVVH
ncbi:hypothetical protein HN51_041742 [Arachis hypogaea]